MTIVEIQYFEGCPHSDEMIKNVKSAIEQIAEPVEFKTVLVDTPEKAEKYKFRGSPTVLINGSDLEGLPEPESGNLACRFYSNGIPSVESIANSIKNIGKIER